MPPGEEQIVGAAKIAIDVAVPLACMAISEIKKMLVEYSERDVFDLRQVGEHYRKHCLGKQIGTFHFDQINISSFSMSQPDSSMENQLPIYFQLQTANQKLPMLYSIIQDKCYTPCQKSNEWIRKMSAGDLSDAIEEMLSYICEYQRMRYTSILERKFPYDPVNMMFEELKVWLLQLSKTRLGVANLIDQLKSRIAYLEAIKMDHGIFLAQKLNKLTAETHVLEIRAAIQRCIGVLECKIIPIVEAAELRQSSREHFEWLRIYMKGSIKSLIKFLYYGLRDNSVSPNFLLDQIRIGEIPAYQGKDNKLLDYVLKFLVSSFSVATVFPSVMSVDNLNNVTTTIIRVNDNNMDVSLGRLVNNDFVTLQGSPFIPNLLTDDFNGLTIDNCLEFFDEKNKKKVKLGILPSFRKKENVEAWLLLCGHIQSLCVCYMIVDEFFDLAGEGGNLLVYKQAYKQLSQVLSCFSDLFNRSETLEKKLHASAKKHYTDCFASSPPSVNATKKDKKWREAYSLAMLAHEDYSQGMKKSREMIGKIESMANTVNQDSYDSFIKGKINRLLELIHNLTSSTRYLRSDKPQDVVMPSRPNNVAFFGATGSTTTTTSSIRVMLGGSLDSTVAKNLTSDELEDLKRLESQLNKYDMENLYLEKLNLCPQYIPLHEQYALFLLQQDSDRYLRRAKKESKEILKYASNSRHALFIKASIEFKNQNYGKALSAANELIGLGPDNSSYAQLLIKISNRKAQDQQLKK